MGILPKKSGSKGDNFLSEIKSKDCRFDEKNIQVEHVIRNNKRRIRVDKSGYSHIGDMINLLWTFLSCVFIISNLLLM